MTATLRPMRLGDILIVPLIPIDPALIYYDQRIRLEVFDIERMSDAAGINVPVPAHTAKAKMLIDPAQETLG